MDVFATLADPVRRALLVRLARGPTRVVDLAGEHPISRPAVSKHLRLLTDVGLVVATERGRERHYRLDVDALTVVDGLLADLRRSPPFAEAALDGLALEVRRTSRERRVTPRQTSNRQRRHRASEEQSA